MTQTPRPYRVFRDLYALGHPDEPEDRIWRVYFEGRDLGYWRTQVGAMNYVAAREHRLNETPEGRWDSAYAGMGRRKHVPEVRDREVTLTRGQVNALRQWLAMAMLWGEPGAPLIWPSLTVEIAGGGGVTLTIHDGGMNHV